MNAAPLFSVVVPSYNRRAILERVLAAWERQAPADLPFEVLVIDDGSGDGTPDLLASWRSRRFLYRFATQANAGPARARNRALEMAAGELVFFAGDDIEPTPTLLAEHLRAHRQLAEPGAAVLGRTCWPPDLPVSATMRHVDGPGAQQFSYFYMDDGATYDFRHLYTSNVSLRRDFLACEPGGFSTEFPSAAFEDAELGYRLARHGLRIVYHAAAVAHHHHAYTARGFFRRQVKAGEMGAIFYRQRPQLEKWVGVRELDAERLRLLTAPSEERARVERVAADLGRWESRALDLASFFDPLDPPPIDGLLLELFSYGVRKGVARGLFEPAVAERLSASFFLASVAPAAKTFGHAMRICGLPVPSADHDTLASLAPPTAPVGEPRLELRRRPRSLQHAPGRTPQHSSV